ncbi:MAG: hypothetical protein Q8847_02695, partial [Sweet potato little leaf phytoplasma]|nr:hypothetical protein [Sweet potato little leaf phytoplasma]
NRVIKFTNPEMKIDEVWSKIGDEMTLEIAKFRKAESQSRDAAHRRPDAGRKTQNRKKRTYFFEKNIKKKIKNKKPRKHCFETRTRLGCWGLQLFSPRAQIRA